MRDPLSAFLHEKVAANAPSTDGTSHQNHFTADPSKTSHDPGERAFAALMAASGGALVSKIVPMLGNMAMRMVVDKDATEFPGSFAAKNRAKNISDVLESEGAAPKSRLMGLWNVSSRQRKDRSPLVPPQFVGGIDDLHLDQVTASHRLNDMQEVVDSFIDKHDLTRKGVRLNMHKGPLSFMGGNRYDPITKQVFLPTLDKEQVLHELGHAADATGSRLGRFRNLADPIIRRSVNIALPLALIAGDAIKEQIPGTIDDHAIEFMQDHAPAIMGATLAATSLYPEAKASYLAYQHIAKTEGPHAARASLKKFLPMWGTYLLGAVPAVVGMSLAKKYMRHAREEKELRSNKGLHTKTASVLEEIGDAAKGVGHFVADNAHDVFHVGKQVGHQTLQMLSEPGLASRVGRAAKHVGTSPEFVYGAMSTAIPAALGSLYLYGTPAGKQLRERIHPQHRDTFAAVDKRVPMMSRVSESWREDNPMRFAGLVAAGAALSGGIIAKFMSDLQRVL